MAILVPLLLWGLLFLFVPFSVIGLRGRLEGIEARLDELQRELRNIALRMPEDVPVRPVSEKIFDEFYTPPPPRPMVAERPLSPRPPIPPVSPDWHEKPARVAAPPPSAPPAPPKYRGFADARETRTEPKFDRPPQ